MDISFEMAKKALENSTEAAAKAEQLEVLRSNDAEN